MGPRPGNPSCCDTLSMRCLGAAYLYRITIYILAGANHRAPGCIELNVSTSSGKGAARGRPPPPDGMELMQLTPLVCRYSVDGRYRTNTNASAKPTAALPSVRELFG